MKFSTAYALVWVSVAVGVSVAVYITKSASPLWAFLIPTLISFSTKDGN